MKELNENIAANTFTPTSKMGKQLMAKCKTLQEENEEIGNEASEGKVMHLVSPEILIASFHFFFLFKCHNTLHAYNKSCPHYVL